MTKKQKKMLYRILAAAVLFLAAKLIPLPMLVSAALYFAAYLTVWWTTPARARMWCASSRRIRSTRTTSA